MIKHWLNHSVGFVHVVFSVAAIVLGTAVILTRKGTRKHRSLGRAYFVMMLAVNGTALMLYELFGRFGPFHWMALASLGVVLLGYWPTRARHVGWKAQHAYFMTGSYVGLLAALASEISTRVANVPFFEAVAVASFVVIAVGVWLMRRLIPRTLSGQQ
jgi:uncharacterized membrane protein